jgi:general secretion pathway protein C
MKTKFRIPKGGWLAIHLFLLGWSAWILAGIVAGAVAPASVGSGVAEPHPAPLRPVAAETDRDYALILRRNIFNSAQTESDAQIPSGSASRSEGELASAPRTTLSLRLVGTVADPTGKGRLAAIERKDSKEQGVYRVDEPLMDAIIVRIERNRVYLARGGGVTEVLETDFDEPATGADSRRADKRGGAAASGADVSESGDGDYVLSDRYVKAQLANMSALLTQVRAVPNVGKDGAAEGFKLFSIKKGSIFDKIGFENQDVVKRVNGVELDSAEKGLELFQALRSEKNFVVDIERGTAKKSLSFNIQ